MWTALIGPISNLAGTWLEGKVEEKKAQSATKVAKAQAEAVIMQRKLPGEIDWDLEAIKGASSSWKDEWLVILFSVPLILAFIPGMEGVVQKNNSKRMWYQYSLGVIVAASFGVRSATKFFGKMAEKKKATKKKTARWQRSRFLATKTASWHEILAFICVKCRRNGTRTTDAISKLQHGFVTCLLEIGQSLKHEIQELSSQPMNGITIRPVRGLCPVEMQKP